MSKFDPKMGYERPHIQLIPLIDVVFFALIFFMVLSVYFRTENQMDISIPESSQAKNAQSAGTEIVINVSSNGNFVVNGRDLSSEGLDDLLQKMGKLSAQQAVIIRADKQAFHKYVIDVLDICARNNIRDISFATSENEE